jgi:hypothetical protein
MQCNVCGVIIFVTIEWYLQRTNIKDTEIERIAYRKYTYILSTLVQYIFKLPFLRRNEMQACKHIIRTCLTNSLNTLSSKNLNKKIRTIVLRKDNE